MAEERKVTADGRDISAPAFDDVFIYVPEAGQIVHISEGVGTNLTEEDIREGYVDYINYSQYDLLDGMQEADGGMILSKEYVRRRYTQLIDSVKDVLELAYGRRDAEFIWLVKRAEDTEMKEEVMRLEDFEVKLVDLLREKFGGDVEISMREILKNNGIRKRGIVLRTEGERFTPILYLEEAYERYLECKDVEKVLGEILDVNGDQIREMEDNRDLQPEQFGDYSKVREHLRFMLVDHEKNKELLQDRAHIRWNDLAVIFYYNLKDGKAHVPINNEHLDLWGKTVKDLYEDALDNVKCGAEDRMFSLGEMFGVEEGPPIHVLTNRMRKYGAVTMLYSPKIRELADRIGSDLVILPSSMNEVLLVPDDDGMHKRYRELVGEVNRLVMDPEEVLSDNIYLYSREKDAVELLPAG